VPAPPCREKEQILIPERRPDITAITQGAGLRRWYWTKDELTAECRRLGMRTTGGKFRLLDRLAHFHETGETIFPDDKKPKVMSRFDWHAADLTPDTIITDSYKNSQNVRRFFKAQIGAHFKFSIASMAWMKENVGRTLGDAVTAIKRLEEAASSSGFQRQIPDGNQFDQYARDFLADNLQMGMKEVRFFWTLKRALPSGDGRHQVDPSGDGRHQVDPSGDGRHRYDPSDLSLKG
jgi:hypothetical protein